jgi:hypothetical protein
MKNDVCSTAGNWVFNLLFCGICTRFVRFPSCFVAHNSKLRYCIWVPTCFFTWIPKTFVLNVRFPYGPEFVCHWGLLLNKKFSLVTQFTLQTLLPTVDFAVYRLSNLRWGKPTVVCFDQKTITYAVKVWCILVKGKYSNVYGPVIFVASGLKS